MIMKFINTLNKMIGYTIDSIAELCVEVTKRLLVIAVLPLFITSLYYCIHYDQQKIMVYMFATLLCILMNIKARGGNLL